MGYSAMFLASTHERDPPASKKEGDRKGEGEGEEEEEGGGGEGKEEEEREKEEEEEEHWLLFQKIGGSIPSTHMGGSQ
ncbi:hypothetical protein LEMLEM_LOCUS18776 [Lemmus lemmus]